MNPPPLALRVDNPGACALAATVTVRTVDGAGWLLVSPTGFAVPAGSSTTLSVTLDAATALLRPATYTGSLRLEGSCVATGLPARRSPAVVAVNLIVAPNHAVLVPAQTAFAQDVATLANAWSPAAPSQLGARTGGRAVWTGRRMLVWGGERNGPEPVVSGAAYDPRNDVWSPMSTLGAPTTLGFTAVWTGTQMIVWGAVPTGGCVTCDPQPPPGIPGGRYDPATDTWSAVSQNGAPSSRDGHSAVWTGARVIVWGGAGELGDLGDGALYDPALDAWSPMSSVGAPSPRSGHTAVWTGRKMIVWGGRTQAGPQSDGAIYDLASNTWRAMTNVDAPTARASASAVWTGAHLVVWGGRDAAFAPLASGGVFDLARGAWRATSAANAPSARSDHTAVWTGARMLVWGGRGEMQELPMTGGIYDPDGDAWTPTAIEADTPTGRTGHVAVWTGTKMLVHGGGANPFTPEDSGAVLR